jgi:hypothetical protein
MMFTRFTIVIIIVLWFGVATTTTVLAIPPLPFDIFGTVKVNNQNASDGTPVEAHCSSGFVRDWTKTVDGESAYHLSIPGDDPDTPAVEGCREGETIRFSLNWWWPQQTTTTWQSGIQQQVNLTLNDTATPTPEPTVPGGCVMVSAAGVAAPNLTATPSRTPVPTCTPTATPTPTVTPTFTPTPTATPLCPILTPVPLWVEPVTSPTTLLTQTINVSSARYGDSVTITAESGTFAATGPLIPITLLPNTIHHLTVTWTKHPLPGCPQTGYTLSTTYDRFGKALIIEQRTVNNERLMLSSSSSGQVGGVKFADEDILLHDATMNRWTLLFDGSDVGLAKVDINGFHWLADGALLFTVDHPITLAGVGQIDDSDIVRFQPTTVGNVTVGSFTLYFDGSDVELTTADEDIDAFTLTADNALLISTLGTAKVGHYTVQDEDLLRFAPTSLGATTSGSWSLYLDGSDLALTQSKEDIGGVMLDQAGDLYFSVAGAFTVPGVSGNGADIVRCHGLVAGENSACTLSLFWHGAAYGFGSEILDGIAIGAVPPLHQTTAESADGAEETTEAGDEGLNEDEPAAEEVDHALEHELFMPFVAHQ